MNAVNDLRSLPSVDKLLKTRPAAEMIAIYGRPLTLEAIRTTLSEIRLNNREDSITPQCKVILNTAQKYLEDWIAPSLIPVVNATGVILHTNLGRAPLSASALQAVQTVAKGYGTLEYDLKRGKRGSRIVHAEALLKRLTGAEAALVVNNNAGAVLLVLTTLARRRRVVVSRTQLVEIGGGFRVPEVMKQSGARLAEVGTTNRVHLADYEAALQEPTALILHAHHSNFRIVGFASEPSLSELAEVARLHSITMVDDLGSGALLDTARFGLGHEPTVQESLADGVDVVCFSGDKLLGGPQAGIIIGRADLLAKIKKHPLARAIRPDKLCLAALSATLLHYIKDEAEREIPVWQMISKTQEQIRSRAVHWLENLILARNLHGICEVIPGNSTVGGGSLPGEVLPTYLLALNLRHPNKILSHLRALHPPIIARIEDERVVLDPRTVLPDQESALLVGLQNVLKDKKIRE